MALPTQTFAQFLSNMQNAILTSTSKITNFTSGSIARAISQAVSGVAMSLQQLLVHVYNTNRLASSYGTDVDSFLNDYGQSRLLQTFATGTITASRATNGIELDVQVGSLCQTPGKKIQFVVIADTNQAAYDPVRNLYYFSPTQFTIDLTVQATANYGGSVGNVSAASLSQIVSGFQGVNTITNGLGFTDGVDTQSDPSAKAGFVTYIAGLPSACTAAIKKAIQSVSPNLSYQIIEYQNFDGSDFPAGFIVVVDDGTGAAGTPFINAVYNAVLAERALGIRFAVYPPSNVSVNVQVHINVSTGGSLAVAQANVTTALQQYINTLGVGVNATYVNIANAIQDVPGVFSYSGMLLNGSGADVDVTLTQLAQAGTVTFV